MTAGSRFARCGAGPAAPATSGPMLSALVGSFAEAQTMMVTVGSGLTATFVVATGQPSDAEFAAHGHLIRVDPDGRQLTDFLTSSTIWASTLGVSLISA